MLHPVSSLGVARLITPKREHQTQINTHLQATGLTCDTTYNRGRDNLADPPVCQPLVWAASWGNDTQLLQGPGGGGSGEADFAELPGVAQREQALYQECGSGWLRNHFPSLPLCPTKHIPRYLIANSASALPWLPGGRVFCSWVFCRYRRQWSSDGMGQSVSHYPAAEVSCPGRGHFIELTGEPHALT